MSNQLKAILEGSSSGAKLIMDAEAYAQQVLLQGKAIPWHDATAYANHLGQTVALLKPQAAVVAMDKMIKQELADNQTLVAAMREKRRSGFALKTFMGDTTFKAAAGALVTTVAKTLHLPIVVQLPSPLEMLYLTARAALTAQADAEPEFDDDDAENAAIYYADWLRAFTDADIDGLIFDERAGDVAEAAYQPVKNTAEHYRWSIGVRREKQVRFSDPQVTIPVLPSDYWTSGQSSDAIAGVVFSEIAKDAVPETVLELLEKLC
ncbi:MAG: hypothetical protein CSA47_00145 [Gammaproteobacteria bacterium]|nr:MAG: hypothetical protein CSA47_00145 [Gammaproteobacteria bacterium]